MKQVQVTVTFKTTIAMITLARTVEIINDISDIRTAEKFSTVAEEVLSFQDQ